MPENPSTLPSREPIDRCARNVFAPMAVRAALQLGIFTRLADGPTPAAALAADLGVGQRHLEALLYQLVMSEFLFLDGDRFANTEMADHFLVSGRPAYIGSIHELWAQQWTNLLQAADGIRTGRPQAKVDFDAMSPEELGGFIRGLHGTTMSAGRALAQRFDFSGVRHLADVGGGSGGLSLALCQEHRSLSATVFELPSIAAIARDVISEAGMDGRISVETADILAEPLEGTYDAIAAKALFQVMSADNARKAMRNIGAALADGGTLLIIGFVLDDTRLSPDICVGMNLLFVNMFDDGQAYTETQYREWLADAGFSDVVRQPFPYPPGASLILARKG